MKHLPKHEFYDVLERLDRQGVGTRGAALLLGVSTGYVSHLRSILGLHAQHGGKNNVTRDYLLNTLSTDLRRDVEKLAQ